MCSQRDVALQVTTRGLLECGAKNKSRIFANLRRWLGQLPIRLHLKIPVWRNGSIVARLQLVDALVPAVAAPVIPALNILSDCQRIGSRSKKSRHEESFYFGSKRKKAWSTDEIERLYADTIAGKQ